MALVPMELDNYKSDFSSIIDNNVLDFNDLRAGFSRIGGNNNIQNAPFGFGGVWFNVLTLRNSADSSNLNWHYASQYATITSSGSAWHGATFVRTSNGQSIGWTQWNVIKSGKYVELAKATKANRTVAQELAALKKQYQALPSYIDKHNVLLGIHNGDLSTIYCYLPNHNEYTGVFGRITASGVIAAFNINDTKYYINGSDSSSGAATDDLSLMYEI